MEVGTAVGACRVDDTVDGGFICSRIFTYGERVFVADSQRCDFGVGAGANADGFIGGGHFASFAPFASNSVKTEVVCGILAREYVGIATGGICAAKGAVRG